MFIEVRVFLLEVNYFLVILSFGSSLIYESYVFKLALS